MNAVTHIHKLNGLYSQYIRAKANQDSSQELLSKISDELELVFNTLNKHYEFIEVNLNNFSTHFPDFKPDENLITEKHEAVKLGNYEWASLLSEKQKRNIRAYLQELNIPSDEYFFLHNGKIYKKEDL